MRTFEENHSWLIWQLADSAFPTGGFAHSGGLEAAWKQGEIRDASDLRSFLEASLRQAASTMIPFVLAAHGSPGRIQEWDDTCEAFLSNHVANRASRLQGRAFLASATRIFGKRTELDAQCEFHHFAPVFGCVTKSLSIDSSTAGELFLFLTLRAQSAAAVRLGVAGPMEAQSMQNDLAAFARELFASDALRGVDQIATTAPLLEIWQGAQDRLYSRLFQT